MKYIKYFENIENDFEFTLKGVYENLMRGYSDSKNLNDEDVQHEFETIVNDLLLNKVISCYCDMKCFDIRKGLVKNIDYAYLDDDAELYNIECAAVFIQFDYENKNEFLTTDVSRPIIIHRKETDAAKFGL